MYVKRCVDELLKDYSNQFIGIEPPDSDLGIVSKVERHLLKIKEQVPYDCALFLIEISRYIAKVSSKLNTQSNSKMFCTTEEDIQTCEMIIAWLDNQVRLFKTYHRIELLRYIKKQEVKVNNIVEFKKAS